MSRSTLLGTAGSALLALGAPTLSLAQSAPAAAPPPQQSSEDLVCQLAGACGAAAVEEVPAESGVSSEARPARRTSATRGFSIGSSGGSSANASGSDRPAFRIVPSAANSRSNAAGTRYGSPSARKPATVSRPAAARAGSPAREVGRADLLITFVSGSSTLTDQAKVNAQQLVAAMQSPVLSGTRFAIEGHTDAVGSRAANIALSQQRAQAVVDFLVANGADRARFDVHGYGFDRPINSRNPRAAANRRVEVVKVK